MDLEQLIATGMLSESARDTILEAWNTKLSEAREQITADLREEFATRYEKDKEDIIEAADQMISKVLESEMVEFRNERKGLVEARVELKKKTKDLAKQVEAKVMEHLKSEMTEFHGEQRQLAESLKLLEQFTIKQVTNELREFQEDKRQLVETKVRLVKEAEGRLKEAKKDFVTRASAIIEATVESALRKEIETFRTDIKEARQNSFGKKIFEAMQAEFQATYHQRDREVGSLYKALKESREKLAEATNLIGKHEKVLSEAHRRIKSAEDTTARNQLMNEMLTPLSKNQKQVMEGLLESVQTKDLRASFKKHIDFVLNESTGHRRPNVLSESRRTVITGDREAALDTADDVSYLKKLAGLSGL